MELWLLKVTTCKQILNEKQKKSFHFLASTVCFLTRKKIYILSLVAKSSFLTHFYNLLFSRLSIPIRVKIAELVGHNSSLSLLSNAKNGKVVLVLVKAEQRLQRVVVIAKK